MQCMTQSAEEMKAIARGITLPFLSVPRINALVYALHGDLGAGKTTFTQGIAETLGITEPVVSPTFTIMKIYKTQEKSVFSHLVHIDAYRLESAEELARLGWNTLVEDPKNCIVIEWPERVEKLIPDTALHITLSLSSDTCHEIIYQN